MQLKVFADLSCFHLPWTGQVQYPYTFLILMVITCGFCYMNGGSKEEDESLLVVTLPELQSSKLSPKVLRHHRPNYPLSNTGVCLDHFQLLHSNLQCTLHENSSGLAVWVFYGIKQKVLIWAAVFDWSARIYWASNSLNTGFVAKKSVQQAWKC